jgi:hypothetical protein
MAVVCGYVFPKLVGANIDLAQTLISVIPNLLGFSVGSMAIILAFSSSNIFSAIAEDGDERSTIPSFFR